MSLEGMKRQKEIAMQKMIEGTVEGDIIRPSEKINAKKVFIMVPERKIDLNKVRRIKVAPALIDEIIEATEYGEGID